jgi:hypothetical protein
VPKKSLGRQLKKKIQNQQKKSEIILLSSDTTKDREVRNTRSSSGDGSEGMRQDATAQIMNTASDAVIRIRLQIKTPN